MRREVEIEREATTSATLRIAGAVLAVCRAKCELAQALADLQGTLEAAHDATSRRMSESDTTEPQ
jgi:hypothetical protein